ncbi:TraB/GumN family protein [Rhodophyticola sp. MJ-SS7]|nr:TraB/GumN family protein [Rhodophyticola sp. MJ-SS7]
MLRHLTALALSLLMPAAAYAACEGENLIAALPADLKAELRAETAAHAYPEGNIWRAEKDGKTVHVVGTVHIHDPRLAAIRDEVAPAMAGADVLILEATTSDQAALQQRIMANPEVAFLTEGPSLIDLLGDETWALLAGRLEERGVPAMVAAQFRPWLVSVTLALPPCAIVDQQAGKAGLDAMLEAEAERLGLAIDTLDDLDRILEVISAGTLDEQVEMLKVALQMDIDGAAMIATTLDSYLSGRHREFVEFSRVQSRLLTGSNASVDAFLETVLVERNRDWAEKLPALIEGRDAVIAVGAAHLSGETGVLMTLERLGYRLTRL